MRTPSSEVGAAEVKLVDVNLLIYAINRDAPEHRSARRWFESAVAGAATIGIAWIVVLAFLRVTTRPGILQRPLAQDVVIGYIDEWLAFSGRQSCESPALMGVVPEGVLNQVLPG